MRRSVLIAIAAFPLLLNFSQAEQNYSVDQPGHGFVFSSEDGGTSSYLGVDIADVSTERLSALKLKEEKGVEVTMVDQDAPAGKAGIKEHDVIVSMNGTSIESGAQLRRMIHETPAGRMITLGLSRDGQPMTLKVQLADKHKEFAFVTPNPGNIHVQMPEIHVPDIDIPAMNMVVVTSSARSGLMVENITPQLGEFFGVKNGNGVLIRSVEKGSRAEKAGFRAGDVIVKVNSEQVHDTSDFAHAVRGRNGNSVSVSIMREKKEQNLNLSLPARKESSDLLDEESFRDEPMVQAQAAVELSELKDELASLGPEMRLAAKTARKAAEQLREEMCKQGQEFRRQTEKQGQQMRKNMEEFRRELRLMKDEWI